MPHFPFRQAQDFIRLRRGGKAMDWLVDAGYGVAGVIIIFKRYRPALTVFR